MLRAGFSFLNTKLSIDLIKQLIYNTVMDAFSALAEPTRRSIIELLAREGHLPASEIYHQFPVSHPAISQHLKVLQQANLVRVEKRAQQRIYQINPEAMRELEQWARQMRELWDERFDRLDKVLEAEKQKALVDQQPASDPQEVHNG
jgi:DNA-binding transcriptional ArsR family regulator